MNRKLITFSRIIKTGAVNFVRNAWLSVAAMAVMVITLTIVLFSLIANTAFNNTVAFIVDKIDVSVYLKDSTSEAQGAELASKLRALPDAKSVTFLSKQAALERYKEQNKDNPALIEAINETDNPIPATIQIKPRDLDKVQHVRDFLNSPSTRDLWEDVSYRDDRKDAIDKIARATNLLQRGGIITVAVFALVSVLVIFNTIQMAIFNRRDELTIMRLLGASTWYIRGPFIVETIIYGIVSGLVSVLLIHTLFVTFGPALQATGIVLILDISYASSYLSENLVRFLLMQVGLGILIGAVSSFIATKRYLKFKTSK